MGLQHRHNLYISHSLIKPTFSDLCHRPHLPAFEDFRHRDPANGGVLGLLFANGESWRRLRRFAIRALRDLGMGRKGTRELVKKEVDTLCER